MALRTTLEETKRPTGYLFLQQGDTARKLMREVVDLPNRHAELFVRRYLQNRGTLLRSIRHLPEYAVLSHQEVAGLESAVAEAFALRNDG